MNSEFVTSVPYLHTEWLILREYRREDFDMFAAHLAAPISAAHLGTADRQTAWRIFCSQAGQWLIHGAGWWAVEEKATGRLVGIVGAFFREESTVMELGWNTYRAFWGHGFANEAAAAAVNHALEIRREPKVRALIGSANASSLRVAKRLGLTYEGDTEIYGKAVGMYARERESPAIWDCRTAREAVCQARAGSSTPKNKRPAQGWPFMQPGRVSPGARYARPAITAAGT